MAKVPGFRATIYIHWLQSSNLVRELHFIQTFYYAADASLGDCNRLPCKSF